MSAARPVLVADVPAAGSVRGEVLRWRGGSIADLAEARRLTSDPRVARQLLDLVATVARPIRERAGLKAGRG